MSDHHPWVPLSISTNRAPPLLCVPGAGASVTSFLELARALGHQRSLFGLQPRGIDGAHAPYASIEEEAQANLRAVRAFCPPGPIHLLGHSHGGFVAFEMARQLADREGAVASVTMVDSVSGAEGRDSADRVHDPATLKEFAHALALGFDVELELNEAAIACVDVDSFLRDLHGDLLAKKCVGNRTTADMLRGPLAVFAVACRLNYAPASPYGGKAYLALARDRASERTNGAKEAAAVARWRALANELEVWQGPGNHFSILRSPHVQVLAKWWTAHAGDSER